VRPALAATTPPPFSGPSPNQAAAAAATSRSRWCRECAKAWKTAAAWRPGWRRWGRPGCAPGANHATPPPRKADATRRHRLSYCPECLKQQQAFDRLQEEKARLKGRRRYQERTAREGAFGASTPSSKIPLKPGADPTASVRAGGARPGPRGHGRRAVAAAQADVVQRVPVGECGPDCGTRLQPKGPVARTVVDVEPLRRQVSHYQLEQKYCPRCRRAGAAPAPGVLPRKLLGNRLLAHVAVPHYV